MNKITADSLDVGVAGSGDINMEVDTDRLGTTISGSGEAVLRGRADVHTAIISGSGDIQGYELATKESKITILGSGESQITVSDTLDVTISGSGDVYYKGSPENIKQAIAGSGKLRSVG